MRSLVKALLFSVTLLIIGFYVANETTQAIAEPMASDTLEMAEVVSTQESQIAMIDKGIIKVSWYGHEFNGRKTANGEVYNMEAFTAAHKKLPFGTLLQVTNPRNGRSVVVRINDRGPFIRGRELDLSKAAARELGILDHGTARVSLKIVTLAGNNQPVIAN